MKVLVQRSGKSSVSVSSKVVGKIDSGLVLFVGFTEGDDISNINYLVKKVLNLRIFPDENGVMNKSILDYGGSILSISQFTLYADTKKGNRPSYINALSGEYSSKLYDEFNKVLSESIHVETGIFGADMEVDITNIGPTTIMLER
ncbi:MAG: D-aminoacyl-tRNA deacylase [Mollicutes bacterium]|nr:D-aminoacyl-tRNA deacylase [Mollicutes bacterium]MDY5874815.1 D-aminoacyl-tRNA deacylase [Bacilli bacterium]